MSDRQEVARLARDHLRRVGELAGRWSPLPHQVPPPPGFYGWMLMAGRGAGKTDTCANYMVRHVQGPPCLKGPHPHWMGIIAPTLGDAATSCFSGPSGISAHDPSAKMVNTTGGTIIRWPNGSEAKLFGAHTEEDVNRLRSGGNRSIAVGTPVRTERGQVPIEQVTTADRVWTRLGLRPVLGSWDHGMRPLWTVRTQSGRELRLTPDHKMWTQRGWARCDQLRVGDTLSSWNHRVENARGGALRCSNVSQISPNSRANASSGPGGRTVGTGGSPSTGARSMSTEQLGSPATAPFLPGRLRFSTGATTPRAGGMTICSSVLRPTTSPTGSERAVALLHRDGGPSSLIVLASSAGLSSTGTGAHGSAPGSAGASTSSKQPPACSHAVCAEAISQSGASPLLSRAPDAVVTISPGETEGHVWDLTVAGEHEFFANDLLAANCLNWLEEMAAWRWLDDAWHHMRFGLRSGPRPHWVASTTPRPRPLIKKIAKGEFEKVVISTATMYDNPHLPAEIRQALEEAYAGTALGAQELLGQIVEQDENALWRRDHIERNRAVFENVERIIVRRTVGVDPSGGAGEQGIVCTAKTSPVELPGFEKPVTTGFVLADASCHLPAAAWGMRAVDTAIEWDADDICVEKNFGGDMAIEVVRSAAEKRGVPIPIRFTVASRGKAVRAAPVGALTEQNRFGFAGTFEALEDQLCTWTPEANYSPDRLDAMVWGPHHLGLVHMGPAGFGTIGTQAALRPIAGPGGGRAVPPEAAAEQKRAMAVYAARRRIG